MKKIAYRPDRVRTYIMQRLSQSAADHRYYLRHVKGEIPDLERYSVEETIRISGL
jgi:hypothetical protein